MHARASPLPRRCVLWSPSAGLNSQGAPEAVNAIVEDTTQCKFEATSPASDEVVLFNILQVCFVTWGLGVGVWVPWQLLSGCLQSAFSG